MLKLYIARHGQDRDNSLGLLNGHRNESLTELGLTQAGQLAAGIQEQGLSFDAVYTSPLSRARTTAETVAAVLGIGVPVVMDALIERDFGIMTGKPVAQITELCAPDVITTDTVTYFLSPPGAETFPEVLVRAGRALDQIHAEHPKGSVLLVTHGDIGKMLYASYYGLDWKETLTRFHLGNCELLVLSSESSANDVHLVRIEQFNH